ncbi:MAG: energy transducer TonB [Chitinophagales bacterium]|nr:energy transducer TonB [Chitinophagales bacterium]
MRKTIIYILFFIIISKVSAQQYPSNYGYPPPPNSNETPPPVMPSAPDEYSANPNKIYDIVQVKASFIGGEVERDKFIKEHLEYPLDALKQGIEGRTILEFVVWKDSTISDIKVLKGFNATCDQAAIDVIKKMPKWNPGMQDGKPVNSRYFLPIFFKLENVDNIEVGSPIMEAPPVSDKTSLDAIPESPSEVIDTNRVYDIVQIRPEFPGGIASMISFIKENLVYPEEAVKNKMEGKTFIQFVVRKDGTVTDVIILKGFDDLCDQAAKEVVMKMPKWKPGIQNGAPVNAKFLIPIFFKLDEKR